MRVNRKSLTNRRPNESLDLVWAGAPLTVCVGFDDEGRVKEVFADHAKVGSDTHALLSDALVLTSILLQSGARISSLARHLGRESVTPGAQAASALGFIVESAARMEAEGDV